MGRDIEGRRREEGRGEEKGADSRGVEGRKHAVRVCVLSLSSLCFPSGSMKSRTLSLAHTVGVSLLICFFFSTMIYFFFYF